MQNIFSSLVYSTISDYWVQKIYICFFRNFRNSSFLTITNFCEYKYWSLYISLFVSLGSGTLVHHGNFERGSLWQVLQRQDHQAVCRWNLESKTSEHEWGEDRQWQMNVHSHWLTRLVSQTTVIFREGKQCPFR